MMSKQRDSSYPFHQTAETCARARTTGIILHKLLQSVLFLAMIMTRSIIAFHSHVHPCRRLLKQHPWSLFAVQPAATLKAAAAPLMDAGKAMARSGELIIDTTNALDNYGGALSAAGASIRNAGDCVAQAAASCRFKTGSELVCDELREAATCLLEGADKMTQAVAEAAAENNDSNERQGLQTTLQELCTPIKKAGEAVEAAGRSIMQGATVSQIGEHFLVAAGEMEQIGSSVSMLAPALEACVLAAQRMNYAAERMREAGYELTGTRPQIEGAPKGKSWIKS